MKTNSLKRIIALVISTVLLTVIVAGCTFPKNSGSASVKDNTTPASSDDSGKKKVDLSLPIVEEPITLKYFINMNNAMKATMTTYAEVEAFKKMEEITNIKIEWIHPTGGNEQFALMVASKDLPDMPREELKL